MLPLGAKLNIGYFNFTFIVNGLLSNKSKIKQDNTQRNSKKDKPSQEKDPIRILEINLLVRNGSFLHILVPCPYKNSSQSFCFNIAHNYFYFSIRISSYTTKQQIKGCKLDNQRNDIDTVIEQILFLFVKLGEILLVFVPL